MTARLRVLDNGTFRDIKSLFVMQAGVLRRLKTLKVMDGDVLQTVGIFVGPLSLNITPGTVSGTGSGFGSQTITTNTAIATPTGGQAPFTYAWTYVSGDNAVILSPTSAATQFQLNVAPNQFRSGTFRCTVTDAYGTTASNTVTAEFTHEGF